MELIKYLDAGYPLLAVESYEEERLITQVLNLLSLPGCKMSRRLMIWDLASGCQRFTEVTVEDETNVLSLLDAPIGIAKTSDPAAPLDYLTHGESSTVPGLLVMLDAHPYFQDPGLVRALRAKLPALRAQGSAVLLVAPQWTIPMELRKDVLLLDFKMPDVRQLQGRIRSFINCNLKNKPKYKDLEVSDAVLNSSAEALLGLTANQAEDALSLVLVGNSRSRDLVFDDQIVTQLFQAKVDQLKVGLLEYIPPGSLQEVAGLQPLCQWAQRRKFCFTEAARQAGLPNAKGVCLVGYPGCGKTIMAAKIAKIFNLPLFKLDIGRLFASKVGETESLTREVIRQMEGIGSACILLDELEQFLSKNATSGGGDSGTSSRMFGTLLNWLSTKTCPVFLIATSNNLDALPPQLTRIGRFDAIFWVDLPNDQDRKEILALNLGSDAATADMSKLVRQTEGFTGAELFALVQETKLEFLSNPENTGTYLEFLQANTDMVKPQYLDHAEFTAMRKQATSKGWLKASGEQKTKKRLETRKIELT